MQSASDIFLGWTESKVGRHFYVRQLKDIKLAPLVELYKSGHDDTVRGDLRLGAGARPCPLRRACSVARQERRLR